MTDQLKKYLLEDRSVRVQAVRLTDTWKAVQANHDYPPAITHLLGELVAASTLLAANIKFDGSLVLQIQGDGPIALLVVECRSDLSLRATVKVREGHEVPAAGDMQSLLNPGGNGRFIVVLDPKHKVPGQQAYQGIVPLEGETVAEALQHYMKASEQLDTRLWLAACPDRTGRRRDLGPRRRAGRHAQARRAAGHRDRHPDPPALLGRDPGGLRPAAGALALSLLPRTRGQHAALAG